MTGAGTLYIPGSSFLHGWHPLTKLTISLCSAVIIFTMPGGWLPPLANGLAAVFLLGRAGLLRPAARLSLRLIGGLAVILLLIHGFLNPSNQNILWSVGPLKLGQEGLIFASLIILRLTAFLFAALILVLATHPARLLQALGQAGLPNSLAYLLGSPLLLLPQMAARVQAIQAAQQARGLETQGRIFQRIRALFPLAAPLVFGALVDVEERSLALEVRGFSASNRKTYLHPLADSPAQRFIRRGLVLFTLGLFIFGILLRLNGFR